MSQPVYKVFLMKYTPAWYKLTQEEKDKLGAAVADTLKQVGGERVKICISLWCSENWMGWGVEKFPSIEAAQQQAMMLFNMGHFQYVESTSYLGTELPEG